MRSCPDQDLTSHNIPGKRIKRLTENWTSIVSLFLLSILLGGVSVASGRTLSASGTGNNSPLYDIGNPNVRDVWVDPVGGSDGNSGESSTAALQTLAEAWNRIPTGLTLSLGYRILLMPGDYPEANLPSSGWMAGRLGTYEFPIILQAANGAHTVRLHGSMDLSDCHYLYMISLDFVTDPGYGGGNVIHVSSSDHILIRDSKLDGFDGSVRAPQETLKINQAQYVYVENCEIAGAFWFPLDFVAVQYGNIVNSRIHNSGDDCMVLKGGTAYFRIEGNEVYDCSVVGFSAGQGTGFDFMVSPWVHYEAYDLKFVNNVLHDIQNAGIAVRGGYNILIAYNTLYRIGIDTGVGASLLLVGQGSRSCDGDGAACELRHEAGGWGPTTVGDGGEWVPNRNVYVYNNIFYNPSPARTMSTHFTISAPATPPTNTNIPSPASSDTNLRIRGNLIWNDGQDLSLGVGDEGQGCQSSNPTCNPSQLLADNVINAVELHLVDPDHGDFRPDSGSTVFTVPTYTIPNFGWDDAPSTPSAPSGDLSNSVPIDRDGATRSSTGPPGAYAGVMFSRSSSTTQNHTSTPIPEFPAPIWVLLALAGTVVLLRVVGHKKGRALL